MTIQSQFATTSSSDDKKPSIPPTGSVCDPQQQVHITFGDDSQSVVVSFVSNTTVTTQTLSQVKYSSLIKGCDDDDKGSDDSRHSAPKFSIAVGSKTVYSQLQFVTPFSLYRDPNTGFPYTTEQAVANLENSSTWAYDKITKEKWDNYKLVKLPLGTSDQNLLSYKNPFVIYDSPYIHTVTISGLRQGQKYYYKPDKSCKTFSFTIPKSQSYPITLGLTADLGATLVSNASVSAILAMKPAAVLFPGDLNYADGWGPIWDTYGQFAERLAANVPILYTG